MTSRSNCDHDGTWDTVSSLYNHIPNIINLSKKAKSIDQTQKHLKNINYLTLNSKVKMRSRWNTTHRFKIIHGTPTYPISLIYLKRQKVIAHTNTLKKYQLFDLKVKGQTEVTMEHDTLSHDYTRYTYIPNIINIS